MCRITEFCLNNARESFFMLSDDDELNENCIRFICMN